MNSQEVYDSWIKEKSQISIRGNFSEDLMNQVYKYEQKNENPSFNLKRLIEFISAHPLTQAAFVAAGFMAGTIRVICVIIAILNKGVING